MDRIGILAGGGRLPLMIAESVAERGDRAHIVGIAGEADPDIARFPHTWVNWGQIGRMVATLRSEGGGEMVIAGSVRRPDLKTVRPDLGFFSSLPQLVGLLAGGDDSVLSRVVQFFEAKGFSVRGAHEVAPDLLAGAGPLGAVALSPGDRADAELGFAVGAALGPLDAGQAVVAAGGRVLAIEGAEGTDAMLMRVAQLRRGDSCAARSGVLTKGPKPGQELRVDMPAIGPRTVQLAAAAGLAGVAVAVGGVLLLDRGPALQAADTFGVALQGLQDAHADAHAEPMEATAEPLSARVMGRLRPGRRDRGDLARALTAVARLAPYDAGSAAVVARAYVLAIGAGEPIAAVLERTLALRQWGLGAGRRVGVLVCRIDAPPDRADAHTHAVAALINQSAAQGLAGVALTGPASHLAPFEAAAPLADGRGLFLVACPRETRDVPTRAPAVSRAGCQGGPRSGV